MHNMTDTISYNTCCSCCYILGKSIGNSITVKYHEVLKFDYTSYIYYNILSAQFTNCQFIDYNNECHINRNI